MIIQFIVSLFATLSFAELFGAPKKELFFCGLTGAIGWVVYVIGLNSNMGTVLANLTATFALTVFSRILSAIRRNPVTVYLIAGIFPLVPGAGIYYHERYDAILQLWHGNHQGGRCHRAGNCLWLRSAAELV